MESQEEDWETEETSEHSESGEAQAASLEDGSEDESPDFLVGIRRLAAAALGALRSRRNQVQDPMDSVARGAPNDHVSEPEPPPPGRPAFIEGLRSRSGAADISIASLLRGVRSIEPFEACGSRQIHATTRSILPPRGAYCPTSLSIICHARFSL